MVTMTPSSRRRFLANLGGAGAMLATGSWLDAIGYAQGVRGAARALVQQPRVHSDFDRRVLGARYVKKCLIRNRCAETERCQASL